MHSCHGLPGTLLCMGWLDSCFLPIRASSPASEEGGSQDSGLRPLPKATESSISYWRERSLSSGTACRLDRELQTCSFPERSPVLAWVTSAAFEPPALLQVTLVKSLRWTLFLVICAQCRVDRCLSISPQEKGMEPMSVSVMLWVPLYSVHALCDQGHVDPTLWFLPRAQMPILAT